MFEAKIIVTLRSSILDPQGSAVATSLQSLSYPVPEVRIGKYMELTLQASDEQEATALLQIICQKVLANPVMEDYRILQLTRKEE
ncbi:MAG: phosphoribosylformylglycinamidine synthase subunit PurS [Symbiobacteriaceae bacterium]|nr:phosphoribosylformylglycinamidine synthase subunit PurS [Symbiobacteriaceae bacterium]